MCRLLETIKIKDGRICHLSWHQGRMDDAVRKLFKIGNKIQLSDMIKIPETANKGIWKCKMIYTTDVEIIEFEAYTPKIIQTLKLIEANDLDYSFKYANRNQINALFEKKGECDDILMVKNGLLTDTSFANICFFDGKSWITPKNPLLNGTCRQRLLHENTIIAKDIKVNDIKSFQGFQLINAMLGLQKNIFQTISKICK